MCMYNPTGTKANDIVWRGLISSRRTRQCLPRNSRRAALVCDVSIGDCFCIGVGVTSLSLEDWGTVTVAVVIPTFRRPQRLQALLDSLSKGTRVPDEVIVVDNDPESSACPEPIPGLPLRIIHAGLDLNPAGARNVGWRSATSNLCFFIDDDNVVEPGAIDQLAHVFEDPEVGLAGPLIYSGDEAIIWCGGIHRSRWTSRTVWPLHGQSDLPDEPTWPTEDMPDAYAVPRTVLETLGGLDEERFPMYYEEADLGARIRNLGLRGVVVRDARIRHYGWVGVSVGATMVRATMSDGAERARRLARNRIRFHALHYRRLERLSALALFIPMWITVTAAACLCADGPGEFD
jgi:GT2 family glycosyltransferase